MNNIKNLSLSYIKTLIPSYEKKISNSKLRTNYIDYLSYTVHVTGDLNYIKEYERNIDYIINELEKLSTLIDNNKNPLSFLLFDSIYNYLYSTTVYQRINLIKILDIASLKRDNSQLSFYTNSEKLAYLTVKKVLKLTYEYLNNNPEKFINYFIISSVAPSYLIYFINYFKDTIHRELGMTDKNFNIIYVSYIPGFIDSCKVKTLVTTENAIKFHNFSTLGSSILSVSILNLILKQMYNI